MESIQVETLQRMRKEIETGLRASGKRKALSYLNTSEKAMPVEKLATMEKMESVALKKAIADYNRRATSQNYQIRTFEEVLDLIVRHKAIVCPYCSMLILGGKHQRYDYSFVRHLEQNANCLRVRANPNNAVKSSPAKENDQSSA